MGHRRSAAEARDPSGPPPSERVFGYFLRAEKVPRPQAKHSTSLRAADSPQEKNPLPTAGG